MKGNEREHYLLTSIGIKSKGTTYILNDKNATGSFSTTALIKLLDRKPLKIFLLLTENSKSAIFPKFKKEIKEFDTDIKIIDVPIPNGINEEEVQRIITLLLSKIPEGCSLTLDITQGLRHIPFLFFTSVLYLHSFKDIEITGIYYGLRETQDEKGRSPFVDLKILLDMALWFHAIKAFRDEKNAISLVKLLKETFNDWKPKELEDKKLRGRVEPLIDQIERFASAYNLGLPLEIGKLSFDLKDTINQKVEGLESEKIEKIPIPIVKDLFNNISQSGNHLIMELRKNKGKWKKEIFLDYDEVNRQTRIVDSYFEVGHLRNAIGLIRELVISRVMLQMYNQNAIKVDWLRYECPDSKKIGRHDIEIRLGALVTLKGGPMKSFLSENQKKLAGYWDILRNRRNELAHHGMIEDVIVMNESDHEKFKGIWKELENRMRDDGFWDIGFGGGSGTLLITSLGLSAGLLYTALTTVEPSKCIILASLESYGFIDDIISKSGYKGQCIPIIMNDPFTGYSEITLILSKKIRQLIIDSDKVVCNITGGTTVMQWVITKMGEEASRLCRNLTWVAMVDRCDNDEYKNDSYVKGELVVLDEKKYNEMEEL